MAETAKAFTGNIIELALGGNGVSNLKDAKDFEGTETGFVYFDNDTGKFETYEGIDQGTF